MLYVWLLLSCGTAHAHDRRAPARRENTRITAPVRIYEAASQVRRSTRRSRPTATPSARAAGRRPPSPRARSRHATGGARVLELGAGTGLASAAAARLGAAVVATDVSDISLELLRRAAETAAFDVQRLDFTDATAVAALGHFDVVVAADTLYEEAIARATARVVRASRGACIVVDPGRPDGRRAFLDELAGLGRFEPVAVSAEELSAFPLGAGLRIASLGVFER